MSGCINDRLQEICYEKDPSIIFHIRSLSAEPSTTSIEKIKSLRIILVSDGYIEYNDYIEFENALPVDGFSYDFVYKTISGKKDFYLFANEESVLGINFEGNPPLPNNLNALNLNLKTFLNSFKPVNLKDPNLELDQQQGQQLSELINSLYFTPEYNTQSGEIFLPYSASYADEFGLEILNNPEISDYEAKMYLVPVATKFNFNFINLCNDDYTVDEITIYSVNSQNYIMANVGSDLTKDFKPLNNPDYVIPDSDKNLYWIYWLAKVAEASHENSGYSDNFNFNQNYGWITDYSLPSGSALSQYNFLQNGILEVLPSTENNPVAYSSGPFYLPESNNSISNSGKQEYQLYMKFTKGTETKNITLSLGNLHSLFRDTHVVTSLTLTDSAIQIYVEIQPWTRKSANGLLREDN